MAEELGNNELISKSLQLSEEEVRELTKDIVPVA